MLLDQTLIKFLILIYKDAKKSLFYILNTIPRIIYFINLVFKTQTSLFTSSLKQCISYAFSLLSNYVYKTVVLGGKAKIFQMKGSHYSVHDEVIERRNSQVQRLSDEFSWKHYYLGNILACNSGTIIANTHHLNRMYLINKKKHCVIKL